MRLKFLIDNAVSFKVSEALKARGFDSVHVREYGIQNASDEIIFGRALEEERVLVSADTDFGAILAIREVAKPSVILFRADASRNPALQARLLLTHISRIEEDLIRGAIIVIEGERIRIRELPIG